MKIYFHIQLNRFNTVTVESIKYIGLSCEFIIIMRTMWFGYLVRVSIQVASDQA